MGSCEQGEKQYIELDISKECEENEDPNKKKHTASGPKWTAEQLEAIKLRNCNLLVAAAAGAGKTAVLVERIIQRISDEKKPVDIDRILVVTFTNAAATEMRERISDAIFAKMDEDPENSIMRRQFTLLGKAGITTIHSFCRDVIKSHIQDIDLDPSFRIADETECVLLRLEAITELFEELYEEKQQDFTELLESYGSSRNDQEIQDMVMNLYYFIQSNPWPDIWLDEMISSTNLPDDTDFSQTPWGNAIIESIHLELKGLINMLNRAISVLTYAEGLEKYLPVFQEDAANIEALLNIVEEIPLQQSNDAGSSKTNYWNMLWSNIHSMEFSRLPNAGKNADKAKQQYVKALRDNVKDTINNRFKKKLMSAQSDDIVNDIKTLHPLLICLVRLVREFTDRYQQKKLKRTILDFNDLEHLCLEILTDDTDGVKKPSKTASEYRERFDEIMVDEYQDSNMVQELILSTISRQDQGEPNVFMVGDVKQSIYRFRQAKPELFMEKYNTYSQDADSLYRKILLYKNFRSRSEIVNAVNFIFSQIMSLRAGELDYTEKEALNPGADYPDVPYQDAVVGGPTELHLIQTVKDDDDEVMEDSADNADTEAFEPQDESTEKPDNIQSEARVVASRILELMKPCKNGSTFHVYDKKDKVYRKLEYKDIVILMRATKNWSDVFVEELSNMGIPVFADTGSGFFKTTEVQIVLSMLQIIDNPLQDIPLLSVLRSPVFEFTTDELVCMRITEKKATLFDALKLLAEDSIDKNATELSHSAAQKAAGFLERLEGWVKAASYMTTDQLIWYLYQETGYYSMVGAMPEGEQRQANLRILYDRARQFEETSYKGLFNFINFVDKLKSSRGDMGSAKILSENDNVVRIMSIHKSKGLEFPVVILAGCGKRFNLMDMNKSVLMHQELGFGPDVVDYKRRISWPSAAKLGIRERIKAETLSEEMRILYVAMTRAREKLIITGSARNLQRSLERWSITASVTEDRLLDIDMLKANSYLDWIGPALLRHKPLNNEKTLRDCTDSADEPDFRLIEDKSEWQFRVWNSEEASTGQITGTSGEKDFFRWLDNLSFTQEKSEYFEEINRRLTWNYSYEKAAKIPAKVTVTELKRRFDSELMGEADRIPVPVPVLVKKPLFLEEKKGLSAAEAGTALHFAMQHLDYKNPDIKSQLDKMVQKDLLTKTQAESIKTDKIRLFLESDIGKRMLSSPVVKREVPFNLEVPCVELYGDLDPSIYEHETFLLQGIIDCYFEEPDGLVLLDYKTDYVPIGGTQTIMERYRMQINYYARALGLLTGKKVKEKYVYLFYNNEVIGYYIS
jgi:ATP-dependent helicase/nuclease subunit A